LELVEHFSSYDFDNPSTKLSYTDLFYDHSMENSKTGTKNWSSIYNFNNNQFIHYIGLWINTLPIADYMGNPLSYKRCIKLIKIYGYSPSHIITSTNKTHFNGRFQ
jgi:hypothetical protein